MFENKWEYNEQVYQHFLDLRKLMIQLEEMYYTECSRRNLPDFGRVFFMLKYNDITQNTYI